MKTYRAKYLTGDEQPDGTVDWYDEKGQHVGVTRNGEGYEATSDDEKGADESAQK
jgi:hypothetical protein